MKITVEDINIKEADGQLDVFIIHNQKKILTLMKHGIMIHNSSIVVSKELWNYLNQMYLDFEGYVKMYTNKQPGLFDF